jgi:DNA-binding MarR family transcriptional regulator
MTVDKAHLIREIVDLQRQVGRAFGQHAASIWIGSGLTVTQLKSLFLIADKGRTNFRGLAEALEVTPSNVTRIIDRLVEQGLVSRTENPEDRREQVLQATDKGRSLLNSIKETGMKHMTQILNLLSLEELTALSVGLSAFIRAAHARQGEANK